jgi:hypothetical protein
MPDWLTRGRIVALGIGVAALVLVTLAFVTPPAHEIHTSDATSVHAQLVESNPFVVGYPLIQPSQSLDTIRCEIWRTRGQHPGQGVCDSAAASGYFPNLTQSPATLYVPWTPCSSFNVEFRPQSRTLVIHCYTSEPWISTEHRVMGVVAEPTLALLLIPAESIPHGNVAVVQDNRTEHLLHDDSYEFQLGTATIA